MPLAFGALLATPLGVFVSDRYADVLWAAAPALWGP